MKCLVVGFGSIGQRHARVLGELGHEVAVLSRAPNTDYPVFADLVSALRVFDPEYVVIANDTGKHAGTLDSLAGLDYQGVTLIEKPLAASLSELRAIPRGRIFVGYVLRFHPVIQFVADFLRDQSLWTLTVYCGQYLPDWRPDRDYRHTYSARPQDGGVIRDLSHELDYVQRIAGVWETSVAAGGHVSTLDISSEDTVSILANCRRCAAVTIHLNYLDRVAERWIVANGPFGTLRADLIAGTASINGQVRTFDPARDTMLRAQHNAVLSVRDAHAACAFEDARTTLHWMDALYLSLADRRWVSRSDLPL